MSQPLTRTQMTAAEMIPDTTNPAHDPEFWCLPPSWDDDAEVVPHRGRYPMYLVTNGRRNGIWRNWTAVEAVVSGFPSAGYRGHQSVEGCIREWQVQCQLGRHAHPPAPLSPVAPAHVGVAAAAATLARFTIHRPMGERQSASTISNPSSVTESGWDDVPDVARYFALWKGGIVHSDREEAKKAFFAAEAKGLRPRILSTSLYEEAQAFGEGIHWVDDD
ncbi:hypothetical protein C8R46DRAFT_1038073 [Mycena filopes]|nr:hypothetical protein C8R46DRAFT_1038073 [Mycena filopes]